MNEWRTLYIKTTTFWKCVLLQFSCGVNMKLIIFWVPRQSLSLAVEEKARWVLVSLSLAVGEEARWVLVSLSLAVEEKARWVLVSLSVCCLVYVTRHWRYS